MIHLSAFADEISADLIEQLDVLTGVGIYHVELRGVWGKNVLDLTDAELHQIKEEMDRRGVRLSAVGSPIGKIGITDPFEPHLERFQRAIAVADLFGTPSIRIFSFFIPQGDNAADHRAAVLDHLGQLTALAAQHGKILLHENERHIYGDTGARCRDLLQAIDSPHLRAVFDPANYVQCGETPYPDCFEMVAPYLTYVHIKDARAADGAVVPAGEGDGGLRDTLARLKSDGYSGFLSIEPHLAQGGQFSGFSGPHLFRVAAQALQGLLRDLNWEWA